MRGQVQGRERQVPLTGVPLIPSLTRTLCDTGSNCMDRSVSMIQKHSPPSHTHKGGGDHRILCTGEGDSSSFWCIPVR